MIIQIASSSYCNPLGILICVSNKKMLSVVPLTERQVTCAITGIGAASRYLDCCEGIFRQ